MFVVLFVFQVVKFVIIIIIINSALLTNDNSWVSYYLECCVGVSSDVLLTNYANNEVHV